jgi:hypothetical protein
MKIFLLTLLIAFFAFAEGTAQLTEQLKNCSNTDKKNAAIRKFIQRDCQLLESLQKSDLAKFKKGVDFDTDAPCQKLLNETGLKESLQKELSASIKADHSSQEPAVILFFLSKIEQENKKSIECIQSTISTFYSEKNKKLETDLGQCQTKEEAHK